jgi:hypothetical protein
MGKCVFNSSIRNLRYPSWNAIKSLGVVGKRCLSFVIRLPAYEFYLLIFEILQAKIGRLR